MYSSNTLRALLVFLVLIAWPVCAQVPMTGAGTGAGKGTPAALTYRGNNQTTDATSVQTASVDIGTASADRLVIVGVGAQNNPTIASVTVNAVVLAADKFTSGADGVAGIYSGVVASGSGAQTIIVTWVGGAFFNRNLDVWTATGLGSNSVRTTGSFTPAGSGSGTISVTATDFMIAPYYIATGGPPVWSGSTQAPTATHDTVFSGSTSGGGAEWNTVASTNVSFSVSTSAGGGTVVMGTYR